eukprot:TRINITY_DN1345_c0_g1_i1.p1 TRINITY_DN1345_c0_g1~~TRINITY_DN1345_c0_g1_i1.p1  ORF type:complete len:756 (+),score=121.92 TRINITY_DN1345_c0_g1_i1:38-2305(+)
MDQLLPVINKLQDAFSTIGLDTIDLPQIVVIGSQSSGKSSVLENIVGREFLPRGSGIVTRRPLTLQLINRSDPPSANNKPGNNEDLSEWGEFGHKPNERFYSFPAIRDEIIRETDRVTGKNKGISHEAIRLTIYSPHVLNLSLVDLPGITRVPVGEQPPDIEKQIRKMIFTYIDKPSAIILAVTAANTDLSNSDALQIAREVDPEGVRTLGVLTKIDIMDQGTDALDMLTGKVIPLKLGFIGVINRSQQDIITNKPIREALKSENEFFSKSPIYRPIAHKCGTLFLTKVLNKILLHHIRDCLPDLKAKILKLTQDAQAEYSSYGDSALDNKNNQGALLLQIITKFSADYRHTIEGKLTEISLTELCGGARINYIFNEIFGQCVNSITPTDGLTTNDIRTAIRNATGPRAALFVPEISFELLVKKQITRMEEPSLQCVDLVYCELQRIISHLENRELQRFATLKERVVDVVNGLLNRCRSPAKDMITNLIKVELSYINTNHPDFIGGEEAIHAVFEKLKITEQQNQIQNASQQGQGPQVVRGPMGTQGASGQGQGHNQPLVPGNGQPQSTPAQGPPTSSSSQPQTQPQPQSQTQPQSSWWMWGGSSPASNQPQNQPQSKPPVPTPSSNKALPQSRPFERVERLEHVPNTIKTASKLSDKEKFETELIQSLMVSYFNIVRKNVKDMVPKTIMHFLVMSSIEQMQNELVRQLYKEELFEQLLAESPETAIKRKDCRARLQVYQRACDVLNEVRDFDLK